MQLAYLSADQLALQRAHALDEHNPFQMVSLMLECARGQPVALQANRCAGQIQGVDHNTHRPGNAFDKVRKG